MSMEHVHTRIFISKFQNAALGLSLDDGVGKFARGQAGTGGVVVEKICMKMEGVDEVELENIHEIDANLFTDSDLYRVILIMEGDAINRVEIIDVIEVHVQTIHD